MSNWEKYLKKDTLEWLLEDNNPSVKYFTLIDLIGEKPNSTEVKATRSKIMKDGVVPQILSKQKPGGYWEKAENFYVRTKYKGTVWTFIILAELAVFENDKRIKQTCEFILERSQHRVSGAFSAKSATDGSGSDQVVPCLTGNMLYSLIKCGYLGDPRVKKGIDWVTKYQRFDDGVNKTQTDWPYNVGFGNKGQGCWGTHTCHMGVVKNLKALSEIPEEQRSTDVKNTIHKASEYLLKHRIYKKSHDTNQIANMKWTNLSFPLMWDFDFLEVLLILSRLGYKDTRMQDAINLLISKQNSNGRWLLEDTFNGRFQVRIEQKGKESKWITLNALRSLKNIYS